MRVHAAAPQTKACRSLVENVCTFSFEEPRCLARPPLDFVTPSHAFASLLTITLGVDQSNPCGPLSRNYACVSLGNVATCLLAKTRRRSPTNPPRTPGPSSDLPASGALAAMDNVGGDPRLSSASRDQKYANFFRRFRRARPLSFSTRKGRSRIRLDSRARGLPSSPGSSRVRGTIVASPTSYGRFAIARCAEPCTKRRGHKI